MKLHRAVMVAVGFALVPLAGCGEDEPAPETAISDTTTPPNTTAPPETTTPPDSTSPPETDMPSDALPELPDGVAWAQRPADEGALFPLDEALPINTKRGQLLLTTAYPTEQIVSFGWNVTGGSVYEFTKIPVGAVLSVDGTTIEVQAVEESHGAVNVWFD